MCICGGGRSWGGAAGRPCANRHPVRREAPPSSARSSAAWDALTQKRARSHATRRGFRAGPSKYDQVRACFLSGRREHMTFSASPQGLPVTGEGLLLSQKEQRAEAPLTGSLVTEK